MSSFALDRFRESGLRTLTIGAIRAYQRHVSSRTPARCRLTPSCSAYGLEAVRRFGALDGLGLTYKRIKRCNRRHPVEYDPVPTRLSIERRDQAPGITGREVENTDFEAVSTRPPGLSFEDYDHRFRLMLAYPENREFYDQVEFKRKIAEFNRYVLELDQYAIQMKVDEVQAGKVNGHYLLKLAGTTSAEYVSFREDEAIDLLIGQLENFFTAVQAGEFRPVWFELDGQVILQPQEEEPVVPRGYSRGENFWLYSDSYTFWDYYWDSYVVTEMLDALADVDFGDLGGDTDFNQFGESLEQDWFANTSDVDVNEMREGIGDSVTQAAGGITAYDAVTPPEVDTEVGEAANGMLEGLAESGGELAESVGESLGDGVEAGSEIIGGLLESLGDLDGCDF